MDGDQPRESVIGKAEPLDEEVELGGPTDVLHSVVQFPPPQHVDVALPEEGVCKERKGKVDNFRSFSDGFEAYFACVQGGTAIPLCWSFSTSVGGYIFTWQKYLKTGIKGLQFYSCGREGRGKMSQPFLGWSSHWQDVFMGFLPLQPL